MDNRANQNPKSTSDQDGAKTLIRTRDLIAILFDADHTQSQFQLFNKIFAKYMSVENTGQLGRLLVTMHFQNYENVGGTLFSAKDVKVLFPDGRQNKYLIWRLL